MGSGHEVEFFEDPRAFLGVAAASLAADPVVSSVLSMVAARWARRRDSGEVAAVDHPLWWAMVRDPAGSVAGTAMGTAPFPPYPPYVLAMTEPAARALAAGILSRGERPGGVNGALPAAGVVAAELAVSQGGAAVVHEHTRLFELRELVWPRRPSGTLRPARPDEAELAVDWVRRFHVEADEQAGRRPDPGVGEHITLEEVRERIEGELFWFWVDADDVPVHLTGANVPAHGVNRVGPVYTPPEQRGRGYASRAVAEVSGHILRHGDRPCLFTDQANPVSNRIYQAIGYHPVVDMANFRIERPGPR